MESDRLSDPGRVNNGYQTVSAIGEEREIWDDTTKAEFRNPQPWWKANFFVKEPLLFGTWDGVFTTCMLNIFGVIVFLRVGWLVGYAGIGLASLIILLSVFVGYAVTVSVIGLVQRLPMEGARCDIFHVVAYVLGRRVGGVVGLLFVFGQAVAVAMYATGLGEAMAELFGWKGLWPVRGVALGTATLLLLIVLAGVQWVIKLQLLLLLILAIAVGDFFIGSFTGSEPAFGFLGYSAELIHNNTAPDFFNVDADGVQNSESFFSVFAVFFPTVVGVASGINMARDIRRPERSVPIGTFAALAVSSVLYLMFALVLAATCTRESLRDDTLIAYRVSLVGGLFLLGLYVSSLSACLGALYAAPRVLQSIASDKIIPALGIMSKGRGANNEPVLATITIGIISYIFIFVGHLNTLAVIVNMPFLLTYGALDYAYFAQAMSSPPDAAAHLYDGALREDNNGIATATGAEATGVKATASDCSETGKLAPVSSNVSIVVHATANGKAEQGHTVQSYGSVRKHIEEEVLGANPEVEVPESERGKLGKRRMGSSRQRKRRLQNFHIPDRVIALKKAMCISEERQERWADTSIALLSRMASKWVALAGFVMSIVVMFLMQWAFALGTVSISLLLYIYIGHTNPGLPPGQADFKLGKWVKSIFRRCVLCRFPGSSPEHDHMNKQVVLPSMSEIQYDVHRQTETGQDFAHRQPWHHTVQQDHPVGQEFVHTDGTESQPHDTETTHASANKSWEPPVSFETFATRARTATCGNLSSSPRVSLGSGELPEVVAPLADGGPADPLPGVTEDVSVAAGEEDSEEPCPKRKLETELSDSTMVLVLEDDQEPSA